ncbi:hypothetical protein [Synechococcus sp. PCC 6312]|uniref:hypothetical protein n=1 Tax=Synechococcus sp. (strain ATCC 27167 / PCC 6312) TaxID=195253 RepID=UPI00029F0230|nr:hypothetical protein [Synechococcus sp. PCC 6312]AFY61989.1 hypothetical protein Syn6312_2927 [Synechococcus sp. PCC 6312]
MAKGFGIPTNKIVGYTLKLFPDVELYAADKPTLKKSATDESTEQSNHDKPSIDVTDDLSQVRIWQNRQDAVKGIQAYATFIFEWMKHENSRYLDVEICALRINSDGELVSEVVKSLVLESVRHQPL